MRTDWHVYNLKRKIVELPPISSRVYDTIVQPAVTDSITADCTPSDLEQDDSSNARDSEQDDMTTATDCLFCLTPSCSTKDNLDHMSACHGFIIPDFEHETLLAYLGFVIAQFHACLYCGHERHSAEAARSHMLAKGHCMLDLSPSSEFLDFWVPGDDKMLNATQGMSDQELRLQSGAVLSSKNAKQTRSRPGRRKLLETSSQRGRK
ncbi:hypothetical protein AC579_6636 [Pseudocercospora musae]|uniref:ZN622/Rei1/Reh1 zinc finger C2H2-type domain-containing protein n=1 Tax=Pseudocercospora musae TaxID=113226 RepID=A0A139I065_9PEZI|nr:hypothetical protein AC579_6636 [Pseudocercospora musae]